MNFVGWSRAFEERQAFGDIPAKVRQTEIAYWTWMVYALALSAVGLVVMLSAPSDGLKQIAFGLFLAVDGAIMWAVVKVWVHVRLALYWIIWDAQKRQSQNGQNGQDG